MEANGAAGLLITFGYQETDPRRAARLWWQRLSRRFSPGARISPREILVVVSVAIICLASYLAYLKLRSQSTHGPAQTSVPATSPDHRQDPVQVSEKTDEPARMATPPARSGSDRSTTGKAPAATATSPAKDVPSGSDEAAADVTRSGGAIANLPLSEVKKVYIELRGDAAFDELRRHLIERLNSSNVVTATEADEADASLKIVIAGDPRGRQIEASARLVNPRGVVLWPNTGRGTRRYSGDTTIVLSSIAKD